MTQQEKMYTLIEEFHQSGKSQKNFCADQGIHPSTFSYWMKKKRLSENPREAFLKIKTTIPSPADQLEILYPNGVRLKTSQKDLSVISALIRLY